eukprot:gene56614-biopygen49056
MPDVEAGFDLPREGLADILGGLRHIAQKAGAECNIGMEVTVLQSVSRAPELRLDPGAEHFLNKLNIVEPAEPKALQSMLEPLGRIDEELKHADNKMLRRNKRFQLLLDTHCHVSRYRISFIKCRGECPLGICGPWLLPEEVAKELHHMQLPIADPDNPNHFVSFTDSWGNAPIERLPDVKPVKCKEPGKLAAEEVEVLEIIIENFPDYVCGDQFDDETPLCDKVWMYGKLTCQAPVEPNYYMSKKWDNCCARCGLSYATTIEIKTRTAQIAKAEQLAEAGKGPAVGRRERRGLGDKDKRTEDDSQMSPKASKTEQGASHKGAGKKQPDGQGDEQPGILLTFPQV